MSVRVEPVDAACWRAVAPVHAARPYASLGPVEDGAQDDEVVARLAVAPA